MKIFFRMALALLPIAAPLAAWGQAEHSHSLPPSLLHGLEHSAGKRDPSPLADKVRRATAQFRDINVVMNDATWVQATPCVSGPNSGAMGVHYAMLSRVGDNTLNADEPEALIYEPLPGGKWRLVGVEFIALAKEWNDSHPGGEQPMLEGHLLNLVGEPNRYRLPAFYELHVWAWRDNPDGSFADWNPLVSCDSQQGD